MTASDACDLPRWAVTTSLPSRRPHRGCRTDEGWVEMSQGSTAVRGRVLHVAPGDAIARLQPQFGFQQEHGYDVRVACGRSSDVNWARLAPFEPIDIPFPRRPLPHRVAATLVELVRAAREWRPTYLHLHSPAVALTVRWVPRSCWPVGMQMVYTVHGYGHVWPPRGRARAIQQAERVLARRTDLMLFQSTEDLDESRGRRYNSRLRYLGNGVEDAWFDMVPAPRSTGPLEIVYVGRMVEEKGVLDLVEAVRGLEGVRLHLVGAAEPTDPRPVDPAAIAATAAPGTVVVHGRVDQPTLRQVVADADVLCLPSYREGVPQSVIEALAAGRPTVVTDVRGCRELVDDGVNGYVVRARDPAGLRLALQRMRDLPAAEYARMSTAARSSVAQGRRLENVHARLLEAYRELEP
ncbi:glycosyltransferase [Mumia sp. ZJ1417]|uniref:glycosyltransferase n=2 Tax=Mumia sp. ZJ1417 TaxID=2708082 RepID=UPI00326627E6